MSHPTCPGYPENVAVADLRTAETFAVLSLRLWADSNRDNDDGYKWLTGFVAAGLDDDAASAFDAFLQIVSTAALRPLDVRCRRCPGLGNDEALFLHALRLLQRACTTGAEMALCEWLPPSAARTALPHALAFALALSDRKLKIPARPSPAALRHPFAFEHAFAHSGRTLTLLH